MGVDSIVVIEGPQQREITSVNGAAVGMDELAQLELVDHFLQFGVRRGHRASVALHSYRLACRQWGGPMSCCHYQPTGDGLDTAFTVDASRITFGRGCLEELGARARLSG